MADPNLKITVSADTSKADAALKGLEGRGNTVAASTGGLAGATKNLNLQYTELNSKITLVQKAYDAVKGLVTPLVTQAKEQEASIRNLTEALKAHGQYTREGIQANEEFARSLSAQIGVDDEVIMGIQATIAGLTELSGTALNDATLATIQYAQVTNRSYESAQRIVTSFVSGATPRIRGLRLEVDKEADAHERVNALLDGTNAGYSQLIARGKDFEGTQARLGVAWENLQEALGTFITTSPAVRSAMQGLIDVTEGWTVILNGQLVEGIKTAIWWVNNFVEPLDVLKIMVRSVAQVFEDSFRGIAFIVETTWNRIMDITTSFADMMVGHSIIPDMVDKSVSEFERMEKSATQSMAGILDRAKLMDIEQRANQLYPAVWSGGVNLNYANKRQYIQSMTQEITGSNLQADISAMHSQGGPRGTSGDPVNVRVVGVAHSMQTSFMGVS